ncbi:ABC transporter substrate-binding protein [Halalkalibacterium ligniniphilum]|uniref:ABC transporter substrate-binding protein n=1 Tax=Halalkalibacterium ligniniphilum TaxID=1134413 RepID=UPI00034DE46D|nr:iron-siderophore ABC transporter substrate-binding protein [Halalkalibacterium ligniniphilum]
MFRKKQSILFAIMISMLLLVVAACGSQSEQEPASGDSEQVNEEQASNEETTDGAYTVEHAMGTVEIEGTPERVVVLTNEGTEALLSIGVTPVGAVQSWTGDPWYEHISEQMEGVTDVGTESEPNLEVIAALQPDLIIGNKMRQEAVYEQLSQIAPTVFAETLRGDWKENFSLYAEAVNKAEEGEEVLANYAQRIADFKEHAGEEILSKEISIIRFMGGDVRIYQKDSFSGVILEELGFARPESQDVDDFAITNATKEMIPQMDGDYLFYFTYETGDGEASKLEEEWLNDPLFQNLSAVQEGNYQKVSDEIWNTAGGVIAANSMLDELEEIFLQ